jgi:hypothetical protein
MNGKVGDARVEFEFETVGLSLYDAAEGLCEEFTADAKTMLPMPGAVGAGVIANLSERRSPPVAALWANINLGQVLVVYELDAEQAKDLAVALLATVEKAKGMDRPEG